LKPWNIPTKYSENLRNFWIHFGGVACVLIMGIHYQDTGNPLWLMGALGVAFMVAPYHRRNDILSEPDNEPSVWKLIQNDSRRYQT